MSGDQSRSEVECEKCGSVAEKASDIVGSDKVLMRCTECGYQFGVDSDE